MCASKPNHFPLQFCSPDILREIFIYCNAEQLSLLYECGSILLNRKMGSPRTVEKFVLTASRDGVRKWPSLISYLRYLRVLEVVAPFPTHFTEIFGLPKTLESIKFDFWEAESCFALSAPSRSHSPSPKHSPSRFVDMKLLFPSLKHLHLEGSESVSDQFIASLPACLETLRLTSYRLGNVNMVTEACLDVLPPQLKTLSMVAPFLDRPSNFAKLPRSLTHLELKSCFLDVSCIPHLPSELYVLIIPENTALRDLDISLLPSSLQVLDVLQNEHISSLCFASLPRHLKSLSMWRLEPRFAPVADAVIPLLISGLPSTLTSLRINNASSWSDLCTLSLPQGLLHLVLHRVKKVSNSFASYLPRSLLTLVLFCGPSSAVNSKCFAQLPRELQKLELSSTSAFQDEDLAHLPPLLIDLDLAHGVDLTNACISLLPRSITRLYLRHNAKITSACCAQLPPKLATFSLSTSKSFSGDNFRSLPRTLTHLALPSATDIGGHTLGDLPRGLKYLDLFSAPTPDDAQLQTLPQNIRSLTLKTATSEMLYRQFMSAMKQSRRQQHQQCKYIATASARMTTTTRTNSTAMTRPNSTTYVGSYILMAPINAFWWLFGLQ